MSGYWFIVMYDLPTQTSSQRKTMNRFRNALQNMGFERLQLSVYIRFCDTVEKTVSYNNAIEKMIPAKGFVRYLRIPADKFNAMTCYEHGKRIEIKSRKETRLTKKYIEV